MKRNQIYGYIQDSTGARHRVTSQAVASALHEADERAAKLRALAERYAKEAEDAVAANKKLVGHWWFRVGRALRVIE